MGNLIEHKQPVRFQHIYKPKVWGGRAFTELMGMPLPPEGNFGESWEMSVRPGSVSVVETGELAGTLLTDIISQAGQDWLGTEAWRAFGGRFPLLIKYLDINDRLSVQVHPNDQQAEALGLGRGKSECWYVVNASPDARLILGTAAGVDRASFERQARSGNWGGLFREIALEKGDFIHIPPGTVHASVAGSFQICEIQQDSDATLRLYDFDRLENGKLRELHLEAALSVIVYEQPKTISRVHHRDGENDNCPLRQNLLAVPEYTVDFLQVPQHHVLPEVEHFQIICAVGGEGKLRHSGQAWQFKLGETWLVPRSCAIEIEGNLDLLIAWT